MEEPLRRGVQTPLRGYYAAPFRSQWRRHTRHQWRRRPSASGGRRPGAGRCSGDVQRHSERGSTSAIKGCFKVPLRGASGRHSSVFQGHVCRRRHWCALLVLTPLVRTAEGAAGARLQRDRKGAVSGTVLTPRSGVFKARRSSAFKRCFQRCLQRH